MNRYLIFSQLGYFLHDICAHRDFYVERSLFSCCSLLFSLLNQEVSYSASITDLIHINNLRCRLCYLINWFGSWNFHGCRLGCYDVLIIISWHCSICWLLDLCLQIYCLILRLRCLLLLKCCIGFNLRVRCKDRSLNAHSCLVVNNVVAPLALVSPFACSIFSKVEASLALFLNYWFLCVKKLATISFCAVFLKLALLLLLHLFD